MLYDQRYQFNFDLQSTRFDQQYNSNWDQQCQRLAQKLASLQMKSDEPLVWKDTTATGDYGQSRYSNGNTNVQSMQYQWGRAVFNQFNQWNSGHVSTDRPIYSYTPIILPPQTESKQFSKVVGDGRVDIEDPKAWEDCLWVNKRQRKLPAKYLCHNCRTPGHHVKDCPKEYPAGIKCTPYQGMNKCVGEFFCEICKRWWLSHNSYSNSTERCKKCKTDLFPKKQFTIERALKAGLYDKPKYRKYKEKMAMKYGSDWETVITNDTGSDAGYSSGGHSSWSMER